MRIRIELPDNRDFAGRLEVVDAGGTVVFGPVPAAGRAHDELASIHNNASRNPLRPYGDTPLGSYSVRGVIDDANAAGTVVWIEPATGEAALADAHGRFRFFIQGGGDSEDLHATTGAIRLRDHDHLQLAALLRSARGRLRCEIVRTDRPGLRISLAQIPAECDPPVLPGRPYVAMRPPAGSFSAAGLAANGRGTGYAPPMFVAAEISGAGGGGTAYGGDAGGTTATPDNPLPVTGVDVAPSPGIDLNLPADLSIVRTMDTPGGFMFPAATSPSGFTPLAGVQVGGWVFSFGTQTSNPYTTSPGTDPATTPYTGNPVGTYSGSPLTGTISNQYTGTGANEPFSNTVVPAPPAAGGDQTTTVPVQRDTLDNQDAQIQEMVQRFQQYDQQLAASQAAQSGTSPSVQPAAPGTPSTGTAAGQAAAPANAQPQPNPQANPVTPPPPGGSNYPFGQASVVGASTFYLPPNTPPPAGTPPPPPPSAVTQPPPPRLESTGAWDRANPSQAAQTGIQEQVGMGFLDPPGANMSTATGATDASISRLIRGQTAEISAYDARLTQGEIGILAPKGASLRGLDYATASQLPNGDYQINVGDTASRFTANPFKTSPGAAKPAWQAELARTFGPNGNFSLPGNPVAEQGVRNAFAAGRISPVQIDTVDFGPQGQGRMAINGVPVPIDSAGTPIRNTGGGGTATSLTAGATDPAGTPSRGGTGGGGMGRSAAGGAALGGVVATGFNLYQIITNPDAHPDPGRELATTAVLGTASGATGATIDSAITNSLVTSGESSAVETALGRSLGGAAAGGPAAALFTMGQMALSDQDYSAVDYEAKGTRSFAAGTAGGLSGALAAGAVGAIGLSEVPLLGTAVGFVGGFLGYLAFDALFGDSIEESVRGQPSEVGDFEVVQDPSGFLSG